MEVRSFETSKFSNHATHWNNS